MLAFTCIFAGYLTVWLPNDAAGLSFIGAEIGEWVKFLPQVRAGELLMSRNFFYLPPVLLGAMMILVTSRWSNSRRTWAMRGLAILVAGLALPSIDAIRFEPASEWLLRLLLVATVGALALLSGLPKKLPDLLNWLLIGVAALVGLLLPLWAYLIVRPVVAELWRQPVAFGPGIWLNSAGNLLVLLLALVTAFFSGTRR